MSVVTHLEPHALNPQLQLAELTEQARGDGAIVTFVGLARSKSRDGAPVNALVLEHHPRLTRRSLEEIGAACAQRFNVSNVRLVHRYGTIRPGEPIVFAGAAALHRRAAFEAADYLMDRLKTDAVFWKQEVGDGGSKWIEPTEADYTDRSRWE